MINCNVTELTHIALDLTTVRSNKERYKRLLALARKASYCDVSSVLVFKGSSFKPVAIDGLSADVLGRRFLVSQHPRLEAIARAGDIVRFPKDSELPDPYDGLIPNQTQLLKVHACIGLPLIVNDRLIGAITLDAFDPSTFDVIKDEDLRDFSRLATTSLYSALLQDKISGSLPNNEYFVAEVSDHPQEMIGESPAMLALRNKLEVVADAGVNVLVTGETGVGKELVALAIHDLSPRAAKELVYLNCAALPESVAESELFGHVKGAFTGAVNHRKGKFERANNSTLFLDEVGELPLGLQAKLLRVLQFGDIQRVGSDENLKVDCRIVAATNRNLADEVAAGRFRADLYHRLSVFPVHVPALRERRDDIALLTGFFGEKCRAKLNLQHITISPEAIKKLEQYHWPGNVRELEHCIYRGAIMAKSEGKNVSRLMAEGVSHDRHWRPRSVILTEQHFYFNQGEHESGKSAASQGSNDDELVNPAVVESVLLQQRLGEKPLDQARFTDEPSAARLPEVTFSGQTSLREATDQFQREYITTVLEQQRGNWSLVAKKLGLDSGNLHRRAKRLGLKA